MELRVVLGILLLGLAVSGDEAHQDNNTLSAEPLQIAAQGPKSSNTTEVPCSGDASVPFPGCFSGLLFETEILISIKGQNVVDVAIRGPSSRELLQTSLSQTGQLLTIGNVDRLLDQGIQLSQIRYCTDQDTVLVDVLEPVAFSIVLNATDCAAVAAEVEDHWQEPPGTLNPTTKCEGWNHFPEIPVCYSGSTFVESFGIRIRSFDGTTEAGTADFAAAGPVTGQLMQAAFTVYGQDLLVNMQTMSEAFANLLELKSLKFCSAKDEIRADVVRPMPLTVVLSRTPCEALELFPKEHHHHHHLGDPGLDTASLAGQCSKDTYGTCKIGNCHWSRGATDCIYGRCQCQPGWCALNGACFPTQSAMSVETGGTCKVFPCSRTRGKVECFRGRCICQIGSYAARGKCYRVTDTGGSCKLFNCRASRGPTDCIANNCVCKKGSVAIDGRCIKGPY